MKKILSLLFVLTCIAGGVFAQDRIVRTDGTRIEAEVLEISPETVRYKRYSNPDGPTYVLPVSEVRRIVYPNGETDLFGETSAGRSSAGFTGAPVESAAAPSANLAGTAQSDEPAQTEPHTSEVRVLRTYAVGDWYECGRVRGVVCSLTEDKLHGLILSVDEIYLPWSTLRRSGLRAAGADDTSDGEVNMRAVERHIEENGLTWADFPAFEWCRARGEGWYLPAIDELLQICANYNGGLRIANDRETRRRFNAALRENGGERMDRLVFYYSSTERDARSALCTHTSPEPPYVRAIPKSDRFLVRAVHKF